MAKFCGGLHFDDSLKIIDGVICDANATLVDLEKTVTTCGQLWDGDLFKIVTRGTTKIITLHNSEGEEIGEPICVKGNCGVGLDGRFFKLSNNKISLQDGFLLTVNVTPKDASVKIVDVDGEEIAPITGKTNIWLLPGIGDKYGINIEYDGYTGKHLTITNDKDQTLNVELEEISKE